MMRIKPVSYTHLLDKLEYNTIVTIIYYEGKWDFVSKKETVDIGKYKFNIR